MWFKLNVNSPRAPTCRQLGCTPLLVLFTPLTRHNPKRGTSSGVFIDSVPIHYMSRPAPGTHCAVMTFGSGARSQVHARRHGQSTSNRRAQPRGHSRHSQVVQSTVHGPRQHPTSDIQSCSESMPFRRLIMSSFILRPAFLYHPAVSTAISFAAATVRSAAGNATMTARSHHPRPSAQPSSDPSTSHHPTHLPSRRPMTVGSQHQTLWEGAASSATCASRHRARRPRPPASS